MKIDWNRITHFSQLIAIALFVGVFFLGFYLGMLYEQRALENSIHDMVIKEIESKRQP